MPRETRALNKEIREMAAVLDQAILIALGDFTVLKDGSTEWYAKNLYDAGYRKHSEGIWKLLNSGAGTCSCCGFTQKNVWDYDSWQRYCGCCGARMTKGES